MSAVLLAALAGATGGAAIGDLLASRAVRRADRRSGADWAVGRTGHAGSGGAAGLGELADLTGPADWADNAGRTGVAGSTGVASPPGLIGPAWPTGPTSPAGPTDRDDLTAPPDLGGLGAIVRVGRRLGGRVGARWPGPPGSAARLEAAGLSPAVAPADLAALRGAGLVVGIAGAVVLGSAAGSAGLLLAAVAPVALVLVPELLIRRRIERRAALMLGELPDAIDLLRIALRGGPLPDAIAAVGTHQQGLLGGELRRAAAEVRLGVPCETALVRLRRRCPAEGAGELLAVLLRVHRHGGSATAGLSALGEDLRARRARAAIDRAARAAPKVQLVVALLLVPAAMLLIAAVLLQLQRG
ncbi:type II secretion system F family protein [Patulibacter defluvii]|uniref:type II secretion system F family protein n=1 Tax=Patulibacter defluvii TaxID=3095358 RepID=UPI002A74A0EE|nr:type II secretion system F family protein [Patulibacter sp. DM4]